MDCSVPGFPVLHHLPELAQICVHWVSDAIQPSHPLHFSSCPQCFPASGSFLTSQLFASSGQSIRASASALSINIQGWSPLGLTGLISLQSKGLSRVFSNTTVQKHQILRRSAFFIVQLSHPCMTTGKNIALIRRTFVGKVMSLLSNMLSRLVITFLPKSKCLYFMAAVPICSDFGAQKIKSDTVSTVSHEVTGPDAMILVFWMLSFRPTFSLSFHFHQEAL